MIKFSRKGRQPVAIPTPQNDRFEDLHALFIASLQADRATLTALAAALARAAGDPAAIFERMRLFAHKLRGAAAIYDSAQLGVAAGGLESAAELALQQRATSADASITAALEVLFRALRASQSGRPEA